MTALRLKDKLKTAEEATPAIMKIDIPKPIGVMGLAIADDRNNNDHTKEVSPANNSMINRIFLIFIFLGDVNHNRPVFMNKKPPRYPYSKTH